MLKQWFAETRTEHVILGAMAGLVLLASMISLAWQRNTAVRERNAAVEEAEKAVMDVTFLRSKRKSGPEDDG